MRGKSVGSESAEAWRSVIDDVDRSVEYTLLWEHPVFRAPHRRAASLEEAGDALFALTRLPPEPVEERQNNERDRRRRSSNEG
jgi:hypothetical protein